jgi:hypothetical protein
MQTIKAQQLEISNNFQNLMGLKTSSEIRFNKTQEQQYPGNSGQSQMQSSKSQVNYGQKR